MENPYEAEQGKVLSRIVGTLEKLNESMLALNHAVAVRNQLQTQPSKLTTNPTGNQRLQLERERDCRALDDLHGQPALQPRFDGRQRGADIIVELRVL
jgi:hypothetical protein